MALTPKMQILRTETPNNPPAELLPGEFGIEMAEPLRLWIGVPDLVDVNRKKLLVDLAVKPSSLIVMDGVPPEPVADNTLWWSSSVGTMYIKYNDGNGAAQWVSIMPVPDVGSYVVKTGDTMSGPLIVDAALTTTHGLFVTPAPTDDAAIYLYKDASGQHACSIHARVADVPRWSIQLCNYSDDNFAVYTYDNAGNFFNAPLRIDRMSGTISGYANIQMGGKNNIFGYPGGASAGGVVGQTDANIVLYTQGGNNWCGMGTDPAGTFWLRTGTANSTGPTLTINAEEPRTAHFQTRLVSNGPQSLLGTATFNPQIEFHAYGSPNAIGAMGWRVSDNKMFMQHLSNSWHIALGPNGSVVAGSGISGKSGMTGAYLPYVHNWAYNVNNGSVQCYVDDSYMGTINLTASDYRIKRDVLDLPGMWDTVKALRPIKYKQKEFSPPSHIAYIESQKELAKTTEGIEVNENPLFGYSDEERWGFIAHELQETMLPSAATAEKDAPDAIQCPNPLTIIAALTKALQEAMARIEALEAKVA